MIGRGEFGQSERIPLHGGPGVAMLIPGSIEHEPEGRENRQHHQEQ
jgi:hypothetical protein